MLAGLLNGFAESLSERYSALTLSWKNIYKSSFFNSNFGSEKSINRIKKEAYDIAYAFLSSEKAIVQENIDAIALEASRNVGMNLSDTIDVKQKPLIVEHLNELRDEYLYLLSLQIERDINSLISTIRKSYFQIKNSSIASGKSLKSSVLEYAMINGDIVRFFFHDRVGSKWDSRKYVKTLYRKMLLSAYNEIVIMILSEAGIKRAYVNHNDKNYTFYGKEISLVEGTSLPTYYDIMDDIFHPNSNAYLKGEVNVYIE